MNKSATNIKHYELDLNLKGRRIELVTKVSCDEGFTLHFDDGKILTVGYSGCEGLTELNGVEIDVSGQR